MEEIGDALAKVFGPEAIGQWFSHALPNLIVAVITFLAFYLLWRLISRILHAVLGRTGVDLTAQKFAQTVAKAVLLTVGLVIAMGQVGIDTGALLTSLGVAGLTIGFAAKDALSNVISGLFIFWDRPFVIGDLVEVDGRYGKVETITMRSTRVVTPDGKMLAIPNTTIVNSTVTSYSWVFGTRAVTS